MGCPAIAREGWVLIVGLIAFAAGIHYLAGFWWASPLWLVVLLAVQFFRDPERQIPQQDQAVVAPAHGRVVAIEQAYDPYLERDAIKISIFMNIPFIQTAPPSRGPSGENGTNRDNFLTRRWIKPRKKMKGTRFGSTPEMDTMWLASRSLGS